MSARQLSERVARVERALQGDLDRSEVAARLYASLGLHVRFTFACLATTDPASGLITWASKSHPLGIGDEEFAALEYGPPDINTFAEVAQRRPPVAVLSIDTGGDLDTCRRHREFMAPRFGFTDELRAVLQHRGVTWGALGLYRGPGDPSFAPSDADLIAECTEIVAAALQRSLFRAQTLDAHRAQQTVEAGAVDDPGPAVMVVGGDDRARQLTESAAGVIEDLGGYDHGALPASVLAVVTASRHRQDGHITTRTRGAAGGWISLRASTLAGGTEEAQDVVVSFEVTPRASLSHLALAAHGLTAREEEISLLVLQGLDTKAIAGNLHLSPYTVQDHLKAVFAKTGVTSRRELTAKLILR